LSFVDAESDEFHLVLEARPTPKMPPKHAFLFDLPFRYVLGTGVAAGALWTFFRPTDVALAEEVSQKPKVLVRTPATRATPSPSPYPYPDPNPHTNLILSSPSFSP